MFRGGGYLAVRLQGPARGDSFIAACIHEAFTAPPPPSLGMLGIAAARALSGQPDLSAEDVARKSMEVR